MRTALLAKAIRPPLLKIDYWSTDPLTAPEPVEVYGTDGGEVFAWFPYSDHGPILPPDLPIFRVPKMQPLIRRMPPLKPIPISTRDDIEPRIYVDPVYTVTTREWAVCMKGEEYRWAMSVYCAFDQTAGDWVVCGDPRQTYEPHYDRDLTMPRRSKYSQLSAARKRRITMQEEISDRQREEIERLSAWALRAYGFIQASPCRCIGADECDAHGLIFDYQHMADES